MSRSSLRAQCLVDIAGMPDQNVGPLDRDARSFERGQDLFVHAVGPAHTFAHGKQPNVIDHRIAAGAVG